MPAVETAQQPTPATESTEEKPAEEKEAPAPKPVVGIIYPPPEVRSILVKLVCFIWKFSIHCGFLSISMPQ